MSDNDALFEVARHTDLSRLSPAMVESVETIADLARDDGYYRAFVSMKRGCDLYDVPAMLRWAQSEGLLSDSLDVFLAIEALEDRPACFTAAEVEKRMAMSDGHCPMCGNRPSFHEKGAYEPNMYRVLGHCGHFQYNSVHDVEAALRHPKTWQGGRWPFSFGQRRADDEGHFLPDWGSRASVHELSTHCQSCRRGSAESLVTRRLVTVLTDMVETARDPSFHALGASPTSALDARETLVALRIRQLARKIVEQKIGEFRLNDAGLKLYSNGLQVDYSHPGKVTFSARVGGDQAQDYAAFVEFANARLAELGIREVKSSGRSLACDEV